MYLFYRLKWNNKQINNDVNKMSHCLYAFKMALEGKN
jgi:hypothetical protein